MRISSTGNVGIGTSSPKRTLHLNNPSALTTKIQITNSSTGATTDGEGFQLGISNDGTANIEQRENLALTFSTNNTERMRIDSAGRVTMPNQPAWRLQPDTTITTDSGVIGWTAASGHNRFINGVTLTGSSNSNVMANGATHGRLNVPVSGKYQVDATFRQESVTTSGNIYLMINGSSMHRMHVEDWGIHPYAHGTISTILNLAANDYIEVRYANGIPAPISGTNDSVNWFSGHLIG